MDYYLKKKVSEYFYNDPIYAKQNILINTHVDICVKTLKKRA